MNHPLHPALVHFPVACWSLATAADVAGLLVTSVLNVPVAALAVVLIAIGVAAAVVAMLAGFVQYLGIEPGHAAMRAAHAHMTLASVATGCYLASLLLRWRSGEAMAPGTLALSLSVLGFVALAMTGWLGGALVYGHGVGVRGRNAGRD